MGRRLWAGSGAHTDELISLARRAARMGMQIASSSLSLSGMGRGRLSYGMRGQGIRLPRGRGEPGEPAAAEGGLKGGPLPGSESGAPGQRPDTRRYRRYAQMAEATVIPDTDPRRRRGEETAATLALED
jgi:hypothetical protein